MLFVKGLFKTTERKTITVTLNLLIFLSVILLLSFDTLLISIYIEEIKVATYAKEIYP